MNYKAWADEDSRAGPRLHCPPLQTPEVSIVLVRPQISGNLGSVARVARNFGLSRLAVVDPAVTPDTDAHRLAVGAGDLLDTIAHFPDLPAAVEQFPIVVTTSSLRGRGHGRSLELAELPGFLAEAAAGSRCAFVFGPEASGMTEEELSGASACLRLPTDPDFPTMNLSHAVAVVLAVATGFAARTAVPELAEALAPAGEVAAAMSHWDQALEAIDFYDTGHRERSLRDWRKLVAGRPLSVREVAILRGVANRVLVSLRRQS